MEKLSLVFAGISMVALTACGSKTDANEKNFGSAISKTIQKDPDVCLGAQKWPLAVPVVAPRKSPDAPPGEAQQLAALESAGLLASQEVEIDEPTFFGKSTRKKMKSYMPTAAAKPYYREKEVMDVSAEKGMRKVKGGDLCWAQASLQKIVKWDAPAKLGEIQQTTVSFTYKLSSVADWAKKPEIQSAFPAVKKMIDGEGNMELKMPVKLTSEGWETL